MLGRLTITFALLALAPFALAACGDDEGSSGETQTSGSTDGGGGGSTVAIAAVPDDSFAFEQDSLQAPAGPTTFEFENPASLGHDFCLEQDGSEIGCSDVVTGSSTTLEADLESGEYIYYCDVDGHRDGGMEGTLTVE